MLYHIHLQAALKSYLSHVPTTSITHTGHADVVRLLCQRGANINCPMRPSRSLQLLLGAHAGATPLHLAADQGNVSVRSGSVQPGI